MYVQKKWKKKRKVEKKETFYMKLTVLRGGGGDTF